MVSLEGQKALVVGAANVPSIDWGSSEAMAGLGDKAKRFVRPLDILVQSIDFRPRADLHGRVIEEMAPQHLHSFLAVAPISEDVVEDPLLSRGADQVVGTVAE